MTPASIKQAMEALKPMAEMANKFKDDQDSAWAPYVRAGEYTVEESRRAAAAYAALETELKDEQA